MINNVYGAQSSKSLKHSGNYVGKYYDEVGKPFLAAISLIGPSYTIIITSATCYSTTFDKLIVYLLYVYS